MYIMALMEVNTDILIILQKCIINLTTFMFLLCIFIIDVTSCIEIIIVFQKFGAGAHVLILLNVMFNKNVFCLTENIKITIINVSPLWLGGLRIQPTFALVRIFRRD